MYTYRTPKMQLLEPCIWQQSWLVVWQLWELCTQALPIGPKYSFNLGHLLSDRGGGESVIYQSD